MARLTYLNFNPPPLPPPLQLDGEFVVDCVGYVVAVYLFYLYAWGIVKMVLKWTVWFPIRVVFWPVFFVFGGKKKTVVKEVPN